MSFGRIGKYVAQEISNRKATAHRAAAVVTEDGGDIKVHFFVRDIPYLSKREFTEFIEATIAYAIYQKPSQKTPSSIRWR